VADNGEGMTRDEAIAEITRRLVDYYGPERVCLFGSAARGDDGADSDLDFCAVLPDNAPESLYRPGAELLLSQRDIPNLAFPLSFNAALRQEEKILDCRSHGNARADFEDTWHWVAPHDAPIGVGRYGRDIMREENTVLTRRPRQHLLIIYSSKPYVLSTHDVDIAIFTKQRAEYVVIEILVGQPARHRCCCRPSNRAWIPTGCHRDSFELRVSSMLCLRRAK
jgi:predicted nucleotidyltransferase